MGRSSTSSDLRSISKPRLYSLLTSFKSFSTRTPIYLSVSPLFLLPRLLILISSDLDLICLGCCLSLSLWFSSCSLFAVWPCPAAWTQPRHAKPPLRSLDKGRSTGNGWNTSHAFPDVTGTTWNITLIEDSTVWVFSPNSVNFEGVWIFLSTQPGNQMARL